MVSISYVVPMERAYTRSAHIIRGHGEVKGIDIVVVVNPIWELFGLEGSLGVILV